MPNPVRFYGDSLFLRLQTGYVNDFSKSLFYGGSRGGERELELDLLMWRECRGGLLTCLER